MDKSFKDEPQSIAELRAIKAHNAGIWSPRDALVSVLRDIDRGEINPDCLVVIYGKRNEQGGVKTSYTISSLNRYETLGLIESGKVEILDV